MTTREDFLSIAVQLPTADLICLLYTALIILRCQQQPPISSIILIRLADQMLERVA